MGRRKSDGYVARRGSIRKAAPTRQRRAVFGVLLVLLTSLSLLPAPRAHAYVVRYPLRHQASLAPQPAGHPTNSCYARTQGDKTFYHCRSIWAVEQNILMGYNVKSLSEADPQHGQSMVVALWDGDHYYEGCFWNGGRYYHCGWEAKNHWTRAVSATGVSNYYLDDLRKLRTKFECATETARFWSGPFDWSLWVTRCGGVRF